MDLLTRLNKIAADFQLNGNNDARLALAACVLLDRNNEVAFDGRDLPGSLARMVSGSSAAQKAVIAAALGGGPIPSWTKYAVTAAQFKAASATPLVDVEATVVLGALPQFTVLHEVVAFHSQRFAGGAFVDGNPALDIGVTGLPTDILSYVGFADSGVGAVSVADYLTVARLSDATASRVIRAATSLQAKLTLDAGVINSLTAGIFNLWLLTSTLPAPTMP